MMFISDELDPYTFRRKMEKTRSVNENMDGNVFISRQSRDLSFVFIMIKVLFSTLYLTWRVNNFVSRQGKSKNRRIEGTKRGDSQFHFDYQLTVLFATSCLFQRITFFVTISC